MSHVCRNCGQVCMPGGDTKLSDWEIREVQGRATDIMRARPRARWQHRTDGVGRQEQLRELASEYGVNIRTLYRYLRRTA